MAPSSSPERAIGDPRWDVPLRALLLDRVARTPQLLATLDDGGRSLTFGRLGELSARVAAELAAHGVEAGTRVAWQLPTWTETLVLVCALSRLQTVQIPLPYAYREHEVRAAMRQTDADLLITPSSWHGYDYSAMVTSVQVDVPDVVHAPLERGVLEDEHWFASIGRIRARRDRPDFGPGVLWVFFTSGTSGAPKGVLHTDRGVTIPATTMADAFELRSDDRSAIAFPLGHIGGVNWLIGSLQSGCCLLLADRLDAETIDRFGAQGVTLAGVTTAFHLAYRDRARALAGDRLFPQVRACPGGAATKPPSLHAEIRTEVGGVGIVSGYGLTECPMISMASIDDPDDKLATTEGRPGPGMIIELHDPATGAVLPAGGTGEIWIRGPQQFRGYVSAEDTASFVDERGFFRTGDLGRIDADGYVVITGRLKDVIIRKGENISAKEVEDHIFAHPDVADVAVVGLPDDAVGERCCAALVMRPGHPAPDVHQLGDYLRRRGLMTQKWPEQVYEVGELPRNAAGKVLKHEIVRSLTALSR
jgi:cyclohexanecarboxylate-CoA ligase